MSIQPILAVLVIEPFILLVPGYFTVVVSDLLPSRRLDWTFSEAMFTVVSASVFVVSVLGLLLAEVGVFSISWLFTGVVIYSMALWGVSWRRRGAIHQPTRGIILESDGGPSRSFNTVSRRDVLGFSCVPRPQIGLELLGVIAVVVLATALFVQPFDYIVGGLDSGTYVNTGVSIGDTGSIIVYDQAAKGLRPSEAELFFGNAQKPWFFGSRLIGFNLVDLGSGAVQPHGFHLFPVWIAILYSLGGVKAGLLATPLFGLLGVLALYFLGKRLFNVHVGLLASFLLTISVGQIWFSRFPVSEVFVQFLLLAGFYLFALTVDHRSRLFAFLAGVSLGMAHLVKIELILLPASIFGFMLLAHAVRKFHREYWYLLTGYSVMLVHAILHAVFVASIYTLAHVANVWLPMIDSLLPGGVGLFSKLLLRQAITTGDAVRSLALAVAIALLAAVCWLVARLAVSGRTRFPRISKEVAGLALFGFVAGLAAYAWFVRPYYPPVDAGLPQMEMAAIVNNRSSLIRLGWYISPLGVLLGLAGFVKAATTEVGTKFLFFVAVAMPTSVLLLYNSFITPLHFWAGRRFVYILIPAFILLAAYALYSLKRSEILDWKANVVPASLAIALVLTLLRPAAPFLTHVDYAGVTVRLAELSSLLPEKGVVLFTYSREAFLFSVPLKYLYKKETMTLGKDAESDPHLSDVLRRWLSEGRRISWITTSNEYRRPPQGFDLTYVATKRINVPEGPGALDSLPGKPHRFETTLEIFEVTEDDRE